ncbi:MAG: glycosyltransferase family 41 protein [Alphaproteobacteria bacterium]|nr:MAG: glycosyltransferase family 41 protein [Alphaproteobacteria bacterium]
MNSTPETTANWKVFESQRVNRELVSKAFEYHVNQNFVEAEKLYRQILEEFADDPTLLNLLGTLLLQKGEYAEAETLLAKANELKPNDNEILNNLGGVYRNLEKWKEAAEVFDQSLLLNRYSWQVHGNLAKTKFELQEYDSAIEHAQTTLELNPQLYEMHKVLADCNMRLRKWEDAEKSYRIYLEHFPDDGEATNNLAFTLEHLKNWQEACDLYKKAYDLRQDSYEVALNYGNILMFFKRYFDASEAYRHALQLKPQHLPTYFQLIQSLIYQFQLDRAYFYVKMMETVPGYDKARMRSLSDRVMEYVFAFEDDQEEVGSQFKIFESVPLTNYPNMFMNYFKYAKDAESTLKLANLVKLHGDALINSTPDLEKKITKTLRPTPRKYPKIRLGFLSSDLKSHVVAKFILPLLTNYNKDLMEIRCYSPQKQIEDAIQKQIRNLVDEFHYVEHMYNHELADLILSDDNDVLIDLNGFTADSRVMLMAKRLAPVQMEWVGYPFTTGISTIDYMIFDRFNKPEIPGYGAEDPLIMPNSYACYVMGQEPEFDPTPAFETNGYITFGTFNNPNKYTPTIVKSWAKCLLAVPDSKFLIIRPEAGSDLMKINVRKEFEKHGVDPERIIFSGNPMGKHLHLYRYLDVSLDVFPLTGGTTTCESMSMGVPVVSRYMEAHHSRLSRSFISNAGFPDLCADNEDGFVNIAANLANDTKLLRWLHANMRPIMHSSPLCDDKLFASDFEIAMQTVVEKHGLR